jgi:amidase
VDDSPRAGVISVFPFVYAEDGTSMARYRSAFVPHDLRQPLRGADHGPLAGLTVAVKDMYDIVGERTGGGNPSWLAMQKPATRHAGVVQKLLDAGGTIIGKTVCDELFFSVMGVNAHYGMPVNPRAPGRIPGGSSSGSASATASGACDLALGSDTGGSVRIPASFCGLYGLRPTWGRIDASGMMLLAPSFDVAGWFAASPGVFHKGGLWLDGKTVPAAIDHVVQLDDCFAEAQADVAAVMHEAVTQLTPHLPRMSHARVAPDGLDQWREIFRVLEFAEIWQLYRRFVEEQKPVFGPGVGERMAETSRITPAEVDAANAIRTAARERLNTMTPPGTVLMLPTAPCIAPPADLAGDAANAFRASIMRMTSISGLTGLPQVTIPIGTASGCPIGLSFIGWAGGDEALLDLAVQLAPYCGITA